MVLALHKSCSDYRASHASAGYGQHYNRTFEEKGHCGALWNCIERPLLESILRPIAGPDRNCLDFACGTGRIARAASPLFDVVVGVDISDQMLAYASVPENVILVCEDITKTSLAESFDVATAFRFFLNAEDDLKRDALGAIHHHLRDGGWLVCNIHLNASCPMGLAFRLLKWLRIGTPRKTLSRTAFSKFLHEAGFQIIDIVPYGYLPRPGPFLPRLCEKLMVPAERLCKSLKISGRYAENFIVVARKRKRRLRADDRNAAAA